jgi:chromosome partitioning protein
MKHVISVVNHKGGVGKTTTAVNLAAAIGESGQRVLVVDFDPQGSASMYFGIESDGKDLLDALVSTIALPVIKNVAEGVDLVPAGLRLIDARQRFTSALGVDLLERCLHRTEGEWDWVIIDCPPSMGVLTLAGLRAGHEVIIPVEANFLALKGLNQLLEFLESLHNKIKDIDIVGLVPCRAQPRRRIHREIMEQLEQQFPGKVTPAVRENVSLAEAPGRGKPVTVCKPRSHGAEDYRQIAQWMLNNFKARYKENNRNTPVFQG